MSLTILNGVVQPNVLGDRRHPVIGDKEQHVVSRRSDVAIGRGLDDEGVRLGRIDLKHQGHLTLVLVEVVRH